MTVLFYLPVKTATSYYNDTTVVYSYLETYYSTLQNPIAHSSQHRISLQVSVVKYNVTFQSCFCTYFYISSSLQTKWYEVGTYKLLLFFLFASIFGIKNIFHFRYTLIPSCALWSCSTQPQHRTSLPWLGFGCGSLSTVALGVPDLLLLIFLNEISFICAIFFCVVFKTLIYEIDEIIGAWMQNKMLCLSSINMITYIVSIIIHHAHCFCVISTFVVDVPTAIHSTVTCCTHSP